MKYKLVFLLALYSCGDYNSVDCDRDDWQGYYRAVGTVLDGNCGEIEPRIIYVNQGVEQLDAGCVETYKNWSEDRCHLDRNLECSVMTDAGSMTFTWRGHISQKDDPGNRLQAIISLSIVSNNTGNVLCSGTYNFNYYRL